MSVSPNNQGSGSPLPRTGRAVPQFDEATDLRVADAERAFKKIYIPYDRQNAILSRINVLRLSSLERRDVPLDGRRLSQVSQAGKSRMLEHYRDKVNATPLADGTINPCRVLYYELKGTQTLKMFCKTILQELKNPHWNVGNADDVLARMRLSLRARNVELLIVDEVQHLSGDSQNKMDITDELKLFLDSGIVPVVFAGNEKSQAFFERNEQLCGRLGSPLDLCPLSGRVVRDRTLFKSFCADLDIALISAEIVRSRSQLDSNAALNGLFKASGGHIGRVVRIVQAAVEHAVSRDADFVELYDLHHAVDTFAMPQRYVAKNPFAR